MFFFTLNGQRDLTKLSKIMYSVIKKKKKESESDSDGDLV